MLKELATQLREGSVTSTELTKKVLVVIREKESLGAFLDVYEESALQEAERFDKLSPTEKAKLPILAGIPGALKDNLLIAGKTTTAGSQVLKDFQAPYSATVVDRLAAHGGIVVGKTNLDEFAMGSSTENSSFQVTKNSFDETRVAGGSSGGSAVAVASGMAYWALGSDTGGSIRQPAAFCGVVGLKPTYGRVSRHGLMAMASSLDQIGTFTKTVEDAAYLLGAIAGEDLLDATAAPLPADKPFEDALGGSVQGLKVGVPKEYFADNLDPVIQKAVEHSLELLKNEGAIIKEVSLPHTRYALPVYYIIQPAEVSSNLARYDGMRYGERTEPLHAESIRSPLFQTYFETRAQYLGAEVKRRVMLGTYTLSAGYYDAYYVKAQKVRRLLKEDFENVFEEVDVLFSPTTPEVAFPIGAKADPLAMYLSDIYTVTANLVGIPALSMPIGIKKIDDKELPIGGQFMAAWFDEETLLRAAHALETALQKTP